MKNYLQFYSILLLVPFIALLSISFSGGAPTQGTTGSPGDGMDCSACHVGADTNNAYGLTLEIQTNIPAGGYELGATYTISIVTTSTGATEHGFQITAENTVAAKVGSFVITDATNTQSQDNGNFVTHTKAGDDKVSWRFNWTAPTTDVGTPITFYAATTSGLHNATGGSTTTNSQMVKTSKLIGGVLGINQAQLLNFSMYPNPSDGQVTLQLPSDTNQASVNVFDYLGKTLLQKSINNNIIDVSNLNTGVYFVRIQTDKKVGTKKLVVR